MLGRTKKVFLGALSGIKLLTKPPRTQNVRLRFTGIKHWPAIEPDPQNGRRQAREALEMISLEYWNAHHKEWSEVRIAISTAKRRVLFGTYTTDWLFDREAKGYEQLSTLLYILPFIRRLIPFLMVIDRHRTLQEHRDGMSRHAIAILKKLKGQLSPEVATLLTGAFRNTWTHDQKMNRLLNFTQAQELLGRCNLYFNEGYVGKQPYTSVRWINSDGDSVATQVSDLENDYVHHQSDPEFTVQVLGSRFLGDEARALLACYHERIVEE